MWQRNMICKICSSREVVEHLAQERMQGLLENFAYYECKSCGCLQLSVIPDDMGKYYAKDFYYSFQQVADDTLNCGKLRAWIKKKRDAAILFQQHGLYSRLAQRYPNPGIANIQRWLSQTNIRSYDAHILDIGCGNGHLLYRLSDLGFTSLTGVDPFLSSDRDDGAVKLISASLEAIDGPGFDFIMLHHSLEHMPNQLEVFQKVESLLSDKGVCLVRIPIKSNGPWKKYGNYWAEWDAPRHFFLHTELSVAKVATEAGLSLAHTDYEADPFPYLCSELYLTGRPLVDPETKKVVEWHDVFSSTEIEKQYALAIKNNTPENAGRAAFYFKKGSIGNPSVTFVLPDEL